MEFKSIVTLKNTHLFFACALLACMPFAVSLMSYLLILWGITGLILFFKDKSNYHFTLKRPGILAMLAYYGIVVLGVSWSENLSAAFFDVQVKLSLLIVPWPILMLASLYRKHKALLLKVFVISNVVAGLLCIAVALYHSLYWVDGRIVFNSVVPGVYEDVNSPPSSWFAYTNFSLFKHVAYFSMYLVMCIFIVLYLLNRGLQLVRNRKVSAILYSFCLIILIASVYFLQSKAGYFSLFFLLMLAAFGYLITKRKWVTGALLVALIIAVGIVFIRTNSRFYYVRTAVEKYDDFIATMKARDYQLMIDRYGIDRIPLWLVTMESASEHFWIGSGTGDVHDELNRKFEQYKLKSFIENKYNAHNQFLETQLAQGIIGLLLLLTCLFVPIFNRKLYTTEHSLSLIFSGLLILNFFFESMLNSFSGVIFMAFFYVFFAAVDGKDYDIADGNQYKINVV